MPAAEVPKTWLLIVDSTLKSLGGHSYNYDLSVAAAARGFFDHVAIYANKAFPLHGTTALLITPIPSSVLFSTLRVLVNRAFPTSHSEKAADNQGPRYTVTAAASPGLPAWLLSLWKNLRALDIAISLKRILTSLELSRTDQVHILLQHADIWEIVGVDLFSTFLGRPMSAQATFHLVLRHDFELTRANHEAAGAFCSRLRRMTSRSAPYVMFHTDSEALTRGYREFSRVEGQFTVLPIPVSIKAADIGCRKAGTSPDLVRVSMLGSSRIEKGFGELEKLLPLFPPRFGSSRVHLAVQVVRDSPDPNVRHVIKWLDNYASQVSEKDPVLELLDSPVPEDVYFSWFARTNILIAPYISPKYAASTSGVFVEALHFHVPTVTLRDTWIANQIDKASASGLKIGEVADNLAEFPKLANAIWTQLERYQRDLASYLRDWQQFNNASRLVQILKNRPA